MTMHGAHVFLGAAAYFTVKKPTCCETKDVSLSTGSGCLPEIVHSLDRGQLTTAFSMVTTLSFSPEILGDRSYGLAYNCILGDYCTL